MQARTARISASFALLLLALLVVTSVLPVRADATLATLRLAWVVIVAGAGYRIVRHGKISRVRRTLFVLTAIAFIMAFKLEQASTTGSSTRSPRAVEVPYCHIAVAADLLQFAHAQFLAVSSGQWALWGPLTLGALWLLITLAIGPAWCAWVCFYGGIDEGFSQSRRRPMLRIKALPGPLRDLPGAVLIVTALLGLATLTPVFCIWACPLKLTTAFLDTASPERTIQTAILVTCGVALLAVLPALTRKRAFCTLVCPYSALAAVAAPLNPFRVTIREESCTQCGLCVQACPTLAIAPADLAALRVGPYCNRCGACIDACPKNAMEYTLLGTPGDSDRSASNGGLGGAAFSLDAGLLFIFLAMLAGGTVSAQFVPRAILLAARALWWS